MSAAENLNDQVYSPPARSDLLTGAPQADATGLEQGTLVADEVRVLEARETRLYHGRLRIVGAGAIAHYTLEVPQDTEDDVPFIMVNGFCGFKSSYAALRHELALDGKPTATLKPVRLQELKHMLHPTHVLHPELVQSMSVGAVANALNEKHGYRQFDLGGHSWGGPIATHMAERTPQHIRSLSLVASAGLDGHSVADMVRRVPKELYREILPYGMSRLRQGDAKTVLQVMKHALTNPARTGLEGLSAATSDIRPAVQRLGSLGIATLGIQYASDEFFMIDKVREHCRDILDAIIEHPDPRMGHLGPQRDPVGTARLINGTLRSRFG